METTTKTTKPIDPKGEYSPTQVAEWLGCSRQNVHLLFAMNRLQYATIENVGRKLTYYVTGQAVLDYLAAYRARPVRKDGRRKWKETRKETRN